MTEPIEFSRDTSSDSQRKAEERLADEILPPEPSGIYEVDESVRKAFPIPGTKVVYAQNYGTSLWGKTAKVTAGLPVGGQKTYFLKVCAPCPTLDTRSSDRCRLLP